MKPLIWWEMGDWNCCLDWRDWNAVWGFGSTPLEAYNNWLRNANNAAENA